MRVLWHKERIQNNERKNVSKICRSFRRCKWCGYIISDDAAVLEFFAENSGKETTEFVGKFLENESFFGQDLTLVPGLKEAVAAYLDDIRANGMREALCRIS